MTSIVRFTASTLASTFLIAATAAGCGSRNSADPAAPPAGPAEEPINYPEGPWWRADINQTVLGVDHILIAYRSAEREEQLLQIPGPGVERPRDEALAIAKQVRAELQKNPLRFADLAREKSDDPTTAALGGSIGEIFAPHLPNGIVDAVGNLKPGEVSRIVETRLGFHIVRRVAVRPAESIDASQITIAYAGTDGIGRPGRQVTRSRDEARALADRVYAEVAASPATFADVARAQSDTFEADIGGDIGQWSTHARNGDPTPLVVLRNLKPGEVSRPLEMTSGFRILKREQPRDRETFSIAAIVIAVNSPKYTEGLERADALAIATDVAAKAKRDPASFDLLRMANCDFGLCTQAAQTFSDGYWIFSSLVAKVRAAKVGEVIAEPIETPIGFAIVRREDETKHKVPVPAPVVLELPVPEMPSLSSATPAQLIWYVNQLRDAAREELNLDPEKWEQASSVFDQLQSVYETAPVEQRGMLTAEVNSEFAKVLGPLKALELARLNERMQRTIAGTTLKNN